MIYEKCLLIKWNHIKIITKIALSSNDEKVLQTLQKITYEKHIPVDTSTGKVFKTKLSKHRK